MGFCTSEEQGGYMNPKKVTYFDMGKNKIAECTDASNSGGFKGNCSDEQFIEFGKDWRDSNIVVPIGLKYECIFPNQK